MDLKIKEALEEIRAVLQHDGGDVQFVEYTPEKVVKVLLQGHCAGCPYSQMTVKSLIEDFLKERFNDDVFAVEAIN